MSLKWPQTDHRQAFYVLFLYSEVKKSILIYNFKIFSAEWFLKSIKPFLGRYSIDHTWKELFFCGGICGETDFSKIFTNIMIFKKRKKHSWWCQLMSQRHWHLLWFLSCGHAGETGIGKSTLMDTLFNTKFESDPATHNEPGVRLKARSYELQESNVRLKLTIVDTVGFGDQINKDDRYILGFCGDVNEWGGNNTHPG